MNQPRPVRIEFHGDSWNVTYVHRKHGGRYGAAVFYYRQKTYGQVVAWVKANPKLVLVEGAK